MLIKMTGNKARSGCGQAERVEHAQNTNNGHPQRVNSERFCTQRASEENLKKESRGCRQDGSGEVDGRLARDARHSVMELYSAVSNLWAGSYNFCWYRNVVGRCRHGSGCRKQIHSWSAAFVQNNFGSRSHNEYPPPLQQKAGNKSAPCDPAQRTHIGHVAEDPWTLTLFSHGYSKLGDGNPVIS